MYKKLLSVLIFCISFSLSANDKLLSMVIDTNQISISDAFKYLVNDEKEKFIELNSDDISFALKKDLMKSYEPDLCYWLYNGENNMEQSAREGRSCLELYLLNGHGSAAFYLSLIESKSQNWNKSIYYYAISKAYGFTGNDKEQLSLLSQHPNFLKLYYIGLEISRVLPILNQDIIKVNKGRSILYDLKIDDPLYYEYQKNPKLKIKYNHLKNNNLSGFLSDSIEDEINGATLLLLSKAKSGDTEALIEYCDRITNKYLSTYCLKTIYHKRESEYALEKYTISLYNNNKLINNNFNNELMFLLGLQSKNKNVFYIFEKLREKFKNTIKITDLYLNYNKGRILKESL